MSTHTSLSFRCHPRRNSRTATGIGSSGIDSYHLDLLVRAFEISFERGLIESEVVLRVLETLPKRVRRWGVLT